jgi:hypothetical protein
MSMDSITVVTFPKEPRNINPNTTGLTTWDAEVTVMTVRGLEMMILHIAQQCNVTTCRGLEEWGRANILTEIMCIARRAIIDNSLFA